MKEQAASVINTRQAFHQSACRILDPGGMEWEVYAQSKRCDHSARASAAMRHKVRGDNGSGAAPWSSTGGQNSEARIAEISVMRAHRARSSRMDAEETVCMLRLMDRFHLKHKNKAACQSSLGQFH